MEESKMESKPDLTVVRVRHPVKFRMLQVKAVKPLSSNLVRVTLSGEDLQDFESASFDDHVKLIVPNPGEEKPLVPTLGPDGPVFPQGQARPVMRDFTPRRFDRQARELDIEFALHEAGPATQWATQAKVGQYLGIGGPRGSMIIPTGYDWHLLIGDETALPAIARRLEELPKGVRAIAMLEVENAGARIDFASKADAHVQWFYRDATGQYGEALLEGLKHLQIPAGEGYVWAAGEGSVMRAARQFLTAERGIDKGRIRAASYWKRGEQGVHENIDD
ncbi:siderophore-interacting protein [Noviherbaspirillum cavernae]|uniref:Siderophore-interacting protein n=1 Tax=Noviherbaspirillum cavernae TaxID=2320862 RepID=A0A418WYZ9_9BURK|nr:siderophore-interacting protein [Noviherbaspirillum cavernae]RJG05467.1 siderophore-interacting protein [Noviherbaspirillum cavernae]